MWLFSCGAAYHFSTSRRIASDHGDGLGLGLVHGSPVAGEGTGAAAGAKPDEGSGVGGTAKKNPWELANILFPNVSIDLERSFFLFKCAFLEAFGWTVLCDVR